MEKQLSFEICAVIGIKPCDNVRNVFQYRPLEVGVGEPTMHGFMCHEVGNLCWGVVEGGMGWGWSKGLNCLPARPATGTNFMQEDKLQ